MVCGECIGVVCEIFVGFVVVCVVCDVVCGEVDCVVFDVYVFLWDYGVVFGWYWCVGYDLYVCIGCYGVVEWMVGECGVGDWYCDFVLW